MVARASSKRQITIKLKQTRSNQNYKIKKKTSFVLSAGWQRVLSRDKRRESPRGAIPQSNQINQRTEVQNNYRKRKLLPPDCNFNRLVAKKQIVLCCKKGYVVRLQITICKNKKKKNLRQILKMFSSQSLQSWI